jgi:hypothetical protein
MSDQYNPLEIRKVGKNMYSYDNELYDSNFPEEWATDHLPETGPKECLNCSYFGSIGGTFFAYCSNCARYYDFKRGPGMWYNYCEMVIDKTDSVFETYMRGLELKDIGDKDMNIDKFNTNFHRMLENRKKLQTLVKNEGALIFENYIHVDETALFEKYDIDETLL